MKRKIIITLLIFLILLANMTVIKSEEYVIDKRLSELNGRGKWNPHIAIENNNMYVVWFEIINKNKTSLFFTKSTDNGNNWSTPKDIFNGSDFSTSQNDIAVYEENIHLVWRQAEGNKSVLYYMNSNNKGETWNTPIKIVNINTSIEPKMEISQKNIHIVWAEYKGGYSEIYYINSNDNGNNWIQPILLSKDDNKISRWQDISVYKENIHVTWIDSNIESNSGENWEIHYRRSIDNGENWNEDTLLASTEEVFPLSSRIDSVGSNIFITWYENSKGSIFTLKSNDNGEDWQEQFVIKDFEHSLNGVCGIKIVEEYVFLFWYGQPRSNREIYWIHSSNLGKNWGEVKQFSDNDPEDSLDLDFEFNNNTFYGVWHDKRDVNNNYNIYFTKKYVDIKKDDGKDKTVCNSILIIGIIVMILIIILIIIVIMRLRKRSRFKQ